jgi:hypothetical protein
VLGFVDCGSNSDSTMGVGAMSEMPSESVGSSARTHPAHASGVCSADLL